MVAEPHRPKVELRLGSLAAPGFEAVRSGFTWLVPDGHVCGGGTVLAFCNIGLHPTGSGADPFADEHHDLQLLVWTAMSGRLVRRPDVSRGGFLDQHNSFRWDADFALGHLLPDGPETAGDASPVRLRVLAGRRMFDLANVRAGLLAGWHDRARAWSAEVDGRCGTLLALATCEQTGIVRGPSGAFSEILSAPAGPAQAIAIQDEPVVPAARVLLEQITRTDSDRRAIADDLARTFPLGADIPRPADWMFAGTFMTALFRSAVTEHLAILRRDGLLRPGPAGAILLSLNAEPGALLRHRRLGYTVAMHRFRFDQLGSAVVTWLRQNFDFVPNGPEDVRDDYLALLGQIRSTTAARLFVITNNSAPPHQEMQSYAGFARPLNATVGAVRANDMNLMLHDLARDQALDIVDADALASSLGTRDHMPDGTHQSGRMHDLLRDEILRLCRERALPGFSPDADVMRS